MRIGVQAYLLRSDIPPEGKPRPPSDGQLQEPLRSAAVEAGLTKMRRPPLISYSLPALEATEYAKEQGKYEEFHRACYEAYWEESQDIGELEVLEQVAEGCDLDWAELEPRLRSEHYRPEVLRQYNEGLRIGFSGIPGFVIGNNAFTGAAPYEVFRLAAQRALSPDTFDQQSALPS